MLINAQSCIICTSWAFAHSSLEAQSPERSSAAGAASNLERVRQVPRRQGAPWGLVSKLTCWQRRQSTRTGLGLGPSRPWPQAPSHTGGQDATETATTTE